MPFKLQPVSAAFAFVKSRDGEAAIDARRIVSLRTALAATLPLLCARW